MEACLENEFDASLKHLKLALVYVYKSEALVDFR